MSKKAEGFSLRFVLINTGNISRKVLSKVLRSFDKNFERLQRHEELYTDIRMEKENMKKTFKKIYQFIVCVMNRDKYVLESKDIKNIRLYEETISDIFQCINHLYDFEICHEEELEE